MKFTKLLCGFIAVAALMSVSVFVPVAAAYPVGFAGLGGPGASGSDPFGHTWRLKVDSWGIPGLGDGTQSFGGPDSATDFHISFFGLPVGVVIDPTPAVGPGGFDTTTRFSNTTDFELWTRVIDGSGTRVSFFAPPSASLETGERFFVNVHFTGEIGQLIGFEATWTGVAEPATLILLGVGLAGLAAARRRR